MNLLNIINVFIGSIFIGLFIVISGKYLLKSTLNKTIKNWIIVMGVILIFTVSHLLSDSGIQMMIIYVIILYIYKTLYGKNVSQCAIAALISYLLVAIGELLFMAGIGVVSKIAIITNVNVFKGDALANLLISILAFTILKLIHNIASNAIVKIKENSKFTLILTSIILLMAIWSLFYRISLNNFRLDESLVLNSILIISLFYVSVVLIKQQYDKSKLSDEYNNYIEYSRQSEKLVEQYSISQHENKNELIIVRSMVHKSNKKLLAYLDEIIKSKDDIQSAWIRYLRYIPFGGLKGIIHNKISCMKDEGINIFLNISNNIGKSSLKELSIKENAQLSKIIGVFLDNAKEAALLSKEKEVSICIFTEDGSAIFEISNTYTNQIELNKIYESGHSTKGKNRGYGLYLVKTIVDENNIFKNETRVANQYFIQILKVDVKGRNS